MGSVCLARGRALGLSLGTGPDPRLVRRPLPCTIASWAAFGSRRGRDLLLGLSHVANSGRAQRTEIPRPPPESTAARPVPADQPFIRASSVVDLIDSASLRKTEVLRLWLLPGLTGPWDTGGCAGRSWGPVAQRPIRMEASGPGRRVRARAGEADRQAPRREPPAGVGGAWGWPCRTALWGHRSPGFGVTAAIASRQGHSVPPSPGAQRTPRRAVRRASEVPLVTYAPQTPDVTGVSLGVTLAPPQSSRPCSVDKGCFCPVCAPHPQTGRPTRPSREWCTRKGCPAGHRGFVNSIPSR